MREITLNNGVKIPVIGTGTNTFGKAGNAYRGDLRGDTKEVDWAIENGYRHFDTAQSYNTEVVVGQGIEASGLAREAFFVTSKLRRLEVTGSEIDGWVREEIAKSLERLETDYIDLFLIHHPWDDRAQMVQVWRILEEYYENGVMKAIGVSNFNEDQLELLFEEGTVRPAVNQIESNVGHWNDTLIDFHDRNGIATVAWSPLRGIGGIVGKKLADIGLNYGKSAAQVVLRYQIERDVIVIPKSHDKKRQAENLDIFDFELSEDERELIQSL